MAGHSHAANIAVRKGKQDAARAKLFSKLSRYIIVAARAGGGDPVTNLRLRYAIDKARAVSMPRENIERAIKRGTGELGGAAMEDLNYEGFGPGQVAIFCDILTDNRNRTIGDVRRIFEKGGGTLGNPGCVSYMFDRKGVFVVESGGKSEDEVMMVALDAGAEDFKKEGDNFIILCDPSAFSAVQAALDQAGIVPAEAETRQVPKSVVDVDLETGRKIAKLLNNLEDNDDVNAVFHNANLTAEMWDEE